MDSINRNQSEDNRDNLTGHKAIEKLKELIKKNSTCFFCTTPLAGPSEGTRPMSVQEADDDGNLWFLSASDSYKDAEIAANPSVKLYFQGSPHSDFLYLEGRATLSKDKNKINELWEPLFKTWFTEGKDDPRISVIKVVPEEGYYWDNKHGNLVASVKMLIGAAIGKTLDDSIEGKLRV